MFSFELAGKGEKGYNNIVEVRPYDEDTLL